MKENISTQKRIQLCLLIEKMNRQEQYCEKLGLENRSTFHGKCIKEGEI